MGGVWGEGGFETRPYEIDCNVGVNCTSRAYSRSGGIQGEGVDSWLRVHWGGICAGMTEGIGPRMREDNGRGLGRGRV